MAINLLKLIIHKIIKEPNETDFDVEYSNACLDVTEPRRLELAETLAESLRKPRIKTEYGGIDPDVRFAQLLEEFIDGGESSDDVSGDEKSFVHFTKNAVQVLFEEVKGIPAARGGYLVFLEYIEYQVHYVAVSLVRDTTGTVFTPSGESLDINATIIADTAKLAMACKINIGKFRNNAPDCLMMINKKTPEVSVYFSKWLGSNDRENNINFTDRLREVIQSTPPPHSKDETKDEENPFSTDEALEAVFENYQSSTEKVVNLHVLSKIIYGDEDYLIDQAQKQNIDLPVEFKPHSVEMKRFVEVNVKSGGVTLKFSRGDFETKKVRLGPDGKTVIIASEDLYREIANERRSIRRGETTENADSQDESSE